MQASNGEKLNVEGKNSNEVEICVESIHDQIHSAETEKAPFDETTRGNDLIDMYDVHDDKIILGHPKHNDIISVNNFGKEEKGYHIQYQN